MAQISQGKGKEHSWPNDRPEKMSDDWEDAIENGTDYEKREKLMKKSFKDLILSSDTLKKGIRNSPILMEMVKSMDGMLLGAEERISKNLEDTGEQVEEFNKSMAGAISSTGKSFIELDQRIAELQDAPPFQMARPVGQEEYLRKSNFGEDNTPSRDKVLELLTKGAIDGDIPRTAVIKYESCGELDPVHVEFVQKSLNG